MFYFIIFVFGACIGSFLNCVIYRLKEKQSFLSGTSFCPKCLHQLGFFDLIPVLSFIFLKGKCRYCGQNISTQYPLVEIATGGLFLLIFNFQQFSPEFTAEGFSIFNEFSIFNFKNFITTLYLLIISCLLIIIFVYDLKHYIIPDKIVYPAIATALIFNFQKTTFGSSLLAGGGAALFFFLLWLVSRGKWMGLGDAKLAFLMGLFLGSPNILTAVFSAFLIGAIMGIVLVMFGKKTLKSQVPFGPFLVVGTFIALFWGREIIKWYLGLVT